MEKELRYKKELVIIKDYMEIHPNMPKYEVSGYTGIPLEVISKLIEQGDLREERGELKLPRRSTINNEKRRELINRLAVESPIHKAKEQKRSQLVIDLINMKSKSVKHEEWDR